MFSLFANFKDAQSLFYHKKGYPRVVKVFMQNTHAVNSWFTPNVTLCSDQVRERCVPLLKETQSLLPPLEEMEKNITGFYQALEKASHITSNTDSEGPVDFKQKCQVTRSVAPTQENFHSRFSKPLTNGSALNLAGVGDLHTELQEVFDRDREEPPDHPENNKQQQNAAAPGHEPSAEKSGRPAGLLAGQLKINSIITPLPLL